MFFRMRSFSLGLVLFFLFALGCMDRQPAPICPVPTEVTQGESLVSGFDGVDLLVVVDNSQSMSQEQEVLATGFFTLINSLVNPIVGPDWPYGAVDNVRVAVVSSDLGLQYGSDHETDECPDEDNIPSSCEDFDGDDGRFQTEMSGTVNIESGTIKCEAGGGQCPADDWDCIGDVCVSPTGEKEPVNCSPLGSDDDWTETFKDDENSELAGQVACMGQLGTGGCGVEQQLEASLRALTRDEQGGFMDENHLLAVLVVSDEEDCSIKDSGLFSTKEWESGTSVDPDDPSSGLLNTACNLPEANEEDFLFDTSRYWEKLVEAKNDQPSATVFAAIVGVPKGADGEKSPCEGTGSELTECLDLDDMELRIGDFETEGGTPYKHFVPACERVEGGELVTSAAPGRRFVKVAKDFGGMGYVYSICNDDWSPAMKEIAGMIQEAVRPKCYEKRLEWTMLTEDEQDDESCENCGWAKCELVVQFEYEEGEDEGCPKSFGLDEDKIDREDILDTSGKIMGTRVFCPLPKLPAELDCETAKARYEGTDALGWFYCEDQRENFEQTCGDEIDNDGDGEADCEDDGCAGCIECGGNGVGCEKSCKYGVELTPSAKNEARGNLISVQCLQQFSFEDENCQENSLESCTDGLDNDGNGIWDCDGETEGDNSHFPDPHCCPMRIKSDGTCDIDDEVFDNCPDSSEGNLPDACNDHAEMLGCTLPD